MKNDLNTQEETDQLQAESPPARGEATDVQLYRRLYAELKDAEKPSVPEDFASTTTALVRGEALQARVEALLTMLAAGLLSTVIIGFAIASVPKFYATLEASGFPWPLICFSLFAIVAGRIVAAMLQPRIEDPACPAARFPAARR